MNRGEAISFFAGLAERQGEVAGELPGAVNWPETIKNVLFNTENHIHHVEDRLVEALGVLMGLPHDEKISEDHTLLPDDEGHRIIAAITAARRSHRFGEELRSGDQAKAESEAIDLLLDRDD